MLINRFYVGDLPDGQGGWVPGKHGALIDPALFERAQTARAANTSRPRWIETRRQPWALSGVAICGGCGANVNALSHSAGRRRIRCAGRTQGNGCEEPSCYADIIEEQIGEVLAGFAVPEEERGRLLAAWRYYQSRHTDVVAERIRLNRRLARLKELYLDGEMERTEYQSQRKSVADALAALPPEGNPESDAGDRLAAFLADVASAWKEATPTERNKLARQLFSSVVVSNRTAVAVVPRPDLRPFFFALPRPKGVNLDGKECTGGSDGDRGCVLELFTPRRVSVPDFRPILPTFMPRWPSRHRPDSARSAHHRARATKLTPDQVTAIRTLAGTKSLRSLAADFSVSHETIRAVLRTTEPATRI